MVKVAIIFTRVSRQTTYRLLGPRSAIAARGQKDKLRTNEANISWIYCVLNQLNCNSKRLDHLGRRAFQYLEIRKVQRTG